ncbi:MAG: hypothetical protein OER12_01870 [Acidimicrobiia bacterium]|nr:hypothetical protein [Acidimicrobiia bacterium]
MVTTSERPDTTETTKRTWTRWGFPLIGLAVVAAAVVVAVIAIGGSSDAPETPTEVMTLLGTAVEEADSAQYADLTVTAPTGQGKDFLEWNVALGLDPDFSDCTKNAASATGNPVTCDVTMGKDYFFSTVLDENLSTTVSVRVDTDGAFDVQGWPPPFGLTTVEADMRAWIQETHPQLEDRMFGSDYADIRFSQEAGELHMQYLHEYLAYREANN